MNLLLLGGFSAVGLLPDSPPTQEASVVMDLPERVGSWEGVPIAPSEEELELLSEDTEFEKRLYARTEPRTLFEQLGAVSVGIVLSGRDMNNSIHRPERCLPSQGFEGLKLSSVVVPVGGGAIPVKRIRSHRDVYTPDGKAVRLENINYYWFVGHEHYTKSHYERILMDMGDRIFKGYNQRWAYFTVSSYITKNLDSVVGRDEAETDERLIKFIQAAFETCVLLDPDNAPS